MRAKIKDNTDVEITMTKRQLDDVYAALDSCVCAAEKGTGIAYKTIEKTLESLVRAHSKAIEKARESL